MSSDENDVPNFSPPTSPLRVRSPPTSPSKSPKTSPIRSPATSVSSVSSDSPSRSIDIRKAKRNKLPSRSTLQRRKQKRLNPESDGEDSDELEQEYDAEVEQLFTVTNEPDQDAAGNDRSETVKRRDSESILSDDSSDESSFSDTSSQSSSVHSLQSSNSLREGFSDGHHSDSEKDDNSDNVSNKTVLSLYAGSEMTANEALLDVLKLYVTDHWTKGSLDRNIKLIKKMLPKPNEFPASSKDAFKKLKDLTSQCSETEFLYCDKCLQLIETVNENCNHSEGHGKFYSFPIADQIKHMFEQRGLASVIDSYRDHESRKPGYICDITDGTEYKKVKQNFPNEYDLTLMWNTDGVALSSSSKQELWPILCTICEVPPRLRSSFTIVAGVFVSGKDPDMNVYLKPFSDSLMKLATNGVSWNHPVSKKTFTSKVTAPVLCADAPAKAIVLKHKSHGSRYACLICEQKTKKIDRPVEEVTKDGKKKPRLRRFLFTEDAAPIRTAERWQQLAAYAERRGKPRKGVIGRSVVFDIPHLNIDVCTCAEYLPLILLGVVKYLIIKIFDERGPWFIGNKVNLEDINNFISKEIKVPDYINRLPRKIKDLSYWKASELLAFLLFYSLPLFNGKLPDPYYQHWLLLVAAVFSLLKETISEDDLNSSDVMLRLFVRDIGALYGANCYTYNMHNLIHLTTQVRRWGPLWATSAFLFESCNGYLGKHVHGTKNLGQELINNIKNSQSVPVLENIVNSSDGGYNFKSSHLNCQLLGKPLQRDILTHDELTAIDSFRDIGIYVLYQRAKVLYDNYTSRIYDNNRKRANSFVLFTGENGKQKYGQVIIFVKSGQSLLLCLVRVYKILQKNLLFHKDTRYVIRHLLPVQETDDLIMIPVENLMRKVLKVGMYVGFRPNTYELNM
ncbi:Lysine-rich arabinogalactan protein 18 [Frankliniella fusca]|uniref:Lysine-rich arabinogalactan protein 18 n=1 Tax=Frankliniella fusca TaxID=407009 RepID=A0AAE1HXC6_9NEOP|nr:Lysine-rich arabinogalactan protein 18 [Frankliniella fusca]